MTGDLPAGAPLPAPDSWEALSSCNRNELRFQACAKCGAVRRPPGWRWMSSRWANQRWGAVQRLSALAFAAELPRRGLGKILRNVLRDANRGLRDPAIEDGDGIGKG